MYIWCQVILLILIQENKWTIEHNGCSFVILFVSLQKTTFFTKWDVKVLERPIILLESRVLNQFLQNRLVESSKYGCTTCVKDAIWEYIHNVWPLATKVPMFYFYLERSWMICWCIKCYDKCVYEFDMYLLIE